MNEVKWGIIGVGDVTEIKSGPAFNKVPNSQIVYVMRRNLDKAEDYAKRHGISKFSNNADDLLKDDEVNAIYIATPPSSHTEYTIKAANAGKHVYVEKPMATTYNECLDMIEACKNNGVKLFVAYYRRELNYFKKVKELIDSKAIGDIKFVDVKLLIPPNKIDFNKENLPWRVKKEIAGGGYFYDLASHQFDFLDYLFGPVKTVNGNSANQLGLYDVEDIVSASFLIESNIIGSGMWCFTMPENQRIDRTEITGSKGKIAFSFFNPAPIELQIYDSTEKFEINYPTHVQQQLITKVVEDILGQKTCVSTGLSGARTNWVMEKIIY